MTALVSHRIALALLLGFLGAQFQAPHVHTAVGSETAIEADAGEHRTLGADHAEDCLLCRMTKRTRAAILAPAVAVDPVCKPRIPVVDAAIHARRGPGLRAGPTPRAPPSLSPLV